MNPIFAIFSTAFDQNQTIFIIHFAPITKMALSTVVAISIIFLDGVPGVNITASCDHGSIIHTSEVIDVFIYNSSV